MGQLLATPAWPPDLATMAYYKTLKRRAGVKGSCQNTGLTLPSAQLDVVRQDNPSSWQGVGRNSLLELCALEIVRMVVRGGWSEEGGGSPTHGHNLRDLPPELVQLIVDVLRVTGRLLSSTTLSQLEGCTFYSLVLEGQDGAADDEGDSCHPRGQDGLGRQGRRDGRDGRESILPRDMCVLFPRRTLERLVVSLGRYSDSFLMFHALPCTKLRVLHLDHCPFVTEASVCALLGGLPRLEEVRVVGCHYVRSMASGRDGVCACADPIGRINTIDGIDEAADPTIVGPGILSPSIRSLDMQSCIRLKRLGALLNASSHHLASLRLLNLASCRSVKNVDAMSISMLDSLEYLDVSYTGMTDAGVAKLAALDSLQVFKVAGVRAVDSSVAYAVQHMHRLRVIDVSRTVLVGNATLHALAVSTSSQTLEVLHAGFTSVTNTGLAACLPLLTNLRVVDFESCNVGDALVELRACERLEQLNIGDTQAGNDVAEALCHLDALWRLDVSFTPMLNDIGMRYIAKISGLRELSMSTMDRVSPDALNQLAKLPRLCSLDVSGCRITDAQCAIMVKLESLKHLDAGCGEMTSRGVEHLSGLTKLARLSLAHARFVADDSVPFLMRMSGLRTLNVSGCPLSDRAIKLLSMGLHLKTLALADRPLRCQLVSDLISINSDLELKGLKN